MKLYEFTITDNQGLKENEILRQAQAIMTEEAGTRGWTECVLEKKAAPERQIDGTILYRFSVQGEESEDSQESMVEEVSSGGSRGGMAASSREEPR